MVLLKHSLRELLLELNRFSEGCFSSASEGTLDVGPVDAAPSCGEVTASTETPVASFLSSQQLRVACARLSSGLNGEQSTLLRPPSRAHPASAGCREGEKSVPEKFASGIAKGEGAEPDLGNASSCPRSEQPSVNKRRRTMPPLPLPPTSAVFFFSRAVASTFTVDDVASCSDGTYGTWFCRSTFNGSAGTFRIFRALVPVVDATTAGPLLTSLLLEPAESCWSTLWWA